MQTKEILIKGIPFQVDYTIHKGSKGVHTLPNGDPGYPDDPDSVYIHALTYTDKNGVEADVYDMIEALGHMGEVEEKCSEGV